MSIVTSPPLVKLPRIIFRHRLHKLLSTVLKTIMYIYIEDLLLLSLRFSAFKFMWNVNGAICKLIPLLCTDNGLFKRYRTQIEWFTTLFWKSKCYSLNLLNVTHISRKKRIHTERPRNISSHHFRMNLNSLYINRISSPLVNERVRDLSDSDWRIRFCCGNS